MSRLSAARMNAPGPKAYTGKKFLGFRKKQPRYNAPISLHGACRSALNEAVRTLLALLCYIGNGGRFRP